MTVNMDSTLWHRKSGSEERPFSNSSCGVVISYKMSGSAAKTAACEGSGEAALNQQVNDKPFAILHRFPLAPKRYAGSGGQSQSSMNTGDHVVVYAAADLGSVRLSP